MKAIANPQASLFFHAGTSNNALPISWGETFASRARFHSGSTARSARHQLRVRESENFDHLELGARFLLATAMIGGFATAIWQMGGF